MNSRNHNRYNSCVWFPLRSLAIIIAVILILLALGCDDSKKNVNTNNSNSKTDSVDSEHIISMLNKNMVHVTEGEFVLGSNKVDTEGVRERYGFAAPLYLDEHPQQRLSLAAFRIDKYEVTNLSYKQYILATRRMMPFSWVNNGYALTKEKLTKMELEKLRKIALDYFKLDVDTRSLNANQLIAEMIKHQEKLDKLPVGGVNWFDAREFCQWRGGRLPSEAEWEKAARGVNGNEYPWGNEWDPKVTNTGDDGKWEEGIAPVGIYESNKSPYGAYDMSGNVWEWVNDWYKPYKDSTYESEAFGEVNKVIRGGGGGIGHYAISYFFRAATRQFSEPEMESDDVGFRCALDI